MDLSSGQPFLGQVFTCAQRFSFAAAEKAHLLTLARESIVSASMSSLPPSPCAADLPPNLLDPRACFVTLRKDKALRGCIGNLQADQPLFQSVINNALNAATRDGRFPPVEYRETSEIRIEISVLSNPEPISGSAEELSGLLATHEYGVVLRSGPQIATFLPQVWEQLPDPISFLDHLARKAGLEAGDWRKPEASLALYRVEAFEEAP